MPQSEILENSALHRFELHEAGETAFLSYEKSSGSYRLIHTEVPSALRGKGVGTKLVQGVLQLIEQKKLKVIPQCPFVIDQLKAHPQYLGAVDEKYKYLVQSKGQ